MEKLSDFTKKLREILSEWTVCNGAVLWYNKIRLRFIDKIVKRRMSIDQNIYAADCCL